MATIIPYVYAFIAVCCYASLAPLSKKFTIDIPPFAFIGITMVFLSIYGLIATSFIDKEFSILKIETSTWIYLAIFSFINFIGFFLYLYAIKYIPVSQYQIIYLITPIIGGLIAYFILSENFKIQYIYSLPFIGIGLFIALKA